MVIHDSLQFSLETIVEVFFVETHSLFLQNYYSSSGLVQKVFSMSEIISLLTILAPQALMYISFGPSKIFKSKDSKTLLSWWVKTILLKYSFSNLIHDHNCRVLYRQDVLCVWTEQHFFKSKAEDQMKVNGSQGNHSVGHPKNAF